MGRPSSHIGDSLLEKEFKCLDHGFIRLVDYMGTDESIVQAARVSYGKGTKTPSEDRNLIRYMMRHHHGTPFEMVEFKWHVRLPIFVARQWIRHRTANVNEYSMRYSEPIEDYFLPIPEEVRKQSQTNKQGGTEVVPFDEAIEIIQKWEEHMENAFSLYNKTNEKDIAREISRIALPLSSYTEWYWKNDLRNTFNFLMLRLDEHAQEEIRVYAEKMAHVIKQITPLAYEAFEDYILNAKTFSALEMNALEKILQGTPLDQAAEEAGLKKRELKEFKEKLPI